MTEKKRISIIVDAAQHEILRTHNINISKLCNEAMKIRADMIMKDSSIDERLIKIDEERMILENQKRREEIESDILNDIYGNEDERINKVLDIIEKMYKVHNYISKPSTMRVCTQHKIDFNEVWGRLPAVWTAAASPYSYDETEKTKAYKDDEGRTTRAGPF